MVYDPYGAVTILSASWTTLSSSAYAWKYGFQGRPLDTTTGLYDFRYRPESATLDRWPKVDPSGFGGGDVNLYRSEGNAPLAASDPTGLNWFDHLTDRMADVCSPWC